MATARFAWGIDIGNRALKAVKLVRDGDGVRIDDFEVVEHETVLSNAGDNRESLIQTALASFIQRHPMKGGAVGVGVSGQSSFARFIKLPPVEPKKIPEIVRFEAIQQIPFPLDDVEWSYQLFQNPESPEVEVGIFAMRKELVNHHISYFTDFDLNVQIVQMNPLAVYNALQHDGRFDEGAVMVIDLGAENTDLLIADNDTIWMRSIPIGGNNFTETLVKAFKLPFGKAEELKRNAATSKYARQIFQAMRPIFADLVAEIQRSIGFYASVHRDSRIQKVLALGGTFRLPGLQKYLQQNLQMDVERLDGLAAGAPSDPKLVPTFNENLLSIVSAYGLALQAMGDTKITSSLLPAAIRREKMWKEKTKWFAAAAALFVVGTGLAATKWVYLDFNQKSSREFYAAKIDSVKTPAQQYDSKWNEIENSGATERQQIADLRKLESYRTLWRNLYIDLFGALPQPPAELASGDVDQIKKIKRADRKIIMIDRVDSRYVEGLDSIVKDPNFATRAMSDNPAPAADQPAPPASPDAANLGNGVLGANARGYIITLQCVTPYSAALDPGGLVDKVFTSSLMNIKPDANRPKMEYGVARVALVSQRKIKNDSEHLARLKSEFDVVRSVRAANGKTPANGAPGAGAPGAPNPGGRGDERFVAPVQTDRPTVSTFSAPVTPFQMGYGPRGGGPGGPGGYRPSMGGGYPGGGYPGGPPSGYPGAGGGYHPAPAQQQPGAAYTEGQISDVDAYKDPVLGESVLDDWEFTLVIAVAIDPPPAGAATPVAAAQ